MDSGGDRTVVYDRLDVPVDSPQLTVSQPYSNGADLPPEAETIRTRPSACLVFTRWLVAIMIALTFLGCLLASKLSILKLGSVFDNVTNTTALDDEVANKDKSSSTKRLSSFLFLLLAIVMPYVCSLIYCIIQGAFRSHRPWPCWRAIFWGLLASVLESVGITLFTMGFLCANHVDVTILAMNGVYFLPIIAHVVDGSYGPRPSSHARADRRIEPCLTVTLVIAMVTEGVGIALTSVLQWQKYDSASEKSVQLPIAMLLLSAAWLPHLQKLQLYPRIADFRKSQQQKPPVSADHPIEQPLRLEEEVKPANVIFIQPEFSCRWKISAMTNFLRAVFVVIGCCVYAQLTKMVDFGDVGSAFQELTASHPLFPAFVISVVCSIGGNVLAFVGCVIRMQYVAFACPLILSNLLSFVLIILYDECLWPFHRQPNIPLVVNPTWRLVLPAALLLLGAQIAFTVIHIFKTRAGIMLRSPVQVFDYGAKLFSMPGYNSMFMEQVLLLSRQTQQQTNQRDTLQRRQLPKINVIICATMYLETPTEMEQLLYSIRAVNEARQKGESAFECHIYLDNGVHEKKLTKKALQLLCKVKSALGLKLSSDDCQKETMPYGLRLTWALPSRDQRRRGMPFYIHFKDNQKVKSKKRWSQVMCMSYVVDQYMANAIGATPENTFILSTDADVRFSPRSVEAMLDLIVRDDRVGAVCARTYPVGSGPVYWYQVFDYAVGHWLQKATNHILGSVLCCQGCFCVYRVEAIKKVLPMYASQVEAASEILTKDMGEDRWLSTMMEWRLLVNRGMSFYFLFYQAMLLFTTLISPALLIMIVVGLSDYALLFSQGTSIEFTILLILAISAVTLTAVFFGVCLKARPGTQLVFAQLVSCLWAIVMAWVIVGTILKMADDVSATSNIVESFRLKQPKPNNVSVSYNDITNKGTTYAITTQPAASMLGSLLTHGQPSSSAISIIVIVGVPLFVALMHPCEAYCLLYGIWYLLFLPASNLVLIMYSICNLADVSWGTREEKKQYKPTEPWHVTARKFFAMCCKTKESEEVKKLVEAVKQGKADKTGPTDAQTIVAGALINVDKIPEFKEDTGEPQAETKRSEVDTKRSDVDKKQSEADTKRKEDDAVIAIPLPLRLWLPQNLPLENSTAKLVYGASGGSHHKRTGWTEHSVENLLIFPHAPLHFNHACIGDTTWLFFMSLYVEMFENNGYEDTSFLYGLGDGGLAEVGIEDKEHRGVILKEIDRLPEPEIEPCIADHVEEWLADIGLSDYVSNLRKTTFAGPMCMETIKQKIIAPDDVVEELCIKKKVEEEALTAKYEFNAVLERDMETDLQQEYLFWETLRKKRLHADSASVIDNDLKEKLTELRNQALLAFIFINVLWLVLILVLNAKNSRQVLGMNLLDLIFVIVFGVIFGTQLLCMIVHRCLTWMHMIAGISWKYGERYYTGWMFNDNRDDNKDGPDVSGRTVTVRPDDDELSRPLIRFGEDSYAARTPDSERVNPLL